MKTTKVLVTRNVRGKLRLMEISYEFNNNTNTGIIDRVTYQFGGKRTEQPQIIIDYGRAGRSNYEQYELELNSLLTKNINKGYKIVTTDVDINSEEQLDKFYPKHVTDARGFKKHMNAKDFNKVSSSTFDKLDFWYCSRKIDGVRCSFYLNDEGNITSSSRGGKDYDVSTRHLREDPMLIELFDTYPKLILDGELYKHGRDLPYISGLARRTLEEEAEACKELEFYIFDVMDNTLRFEDRVGILEDVAVELGCSDVSFDNFTVEGKHHFRVLPQEKVTGWLNIKKKHDQYVEEGFEGCIIRNPDKKYRFGGRTNDMIKVKQYIDEEFKIVGWKPGRRGVEDMVFTLITDDGKEFDAKPHGSRELKEEYVENMDSIIGKMGTVKFFMWYNNTPQQPTMKAIRDYE